jgi:hypothetical protein
MFNRKDHKDVVVEPVAPLLSLNQSSHGVTVNVTAVLCATFPQVAVMVTS